MEEKPRHQCLVYGGSPAKMLPTIAVCVKQRLTDNFRCLYLNSPAMVVGLRSYLYAIDVDVAQEVSAGRLILSSEQSQLVDGQFQATVILAQLEDAVTAALSDGFNGLWATGDMTWELGRDHNLKKLVDYEWELNKLFQKHPQLAGVCQYHAGTLPDDIMANGLVSHPTIIINETLAHLNPYYLQSEQPPQPISSSPSLSHTIQNLCALQL